MSKPRTVIVLEAVDWAMNYAQLDTGYKFAPIRGMVCGFLVKETKKYLTLSQQWFTAEDQVRQTITIPKCNIKWRQDSKC